MQQTVPPLATAQQKQLQQVDTHQTGMGEIETRTAWDAHQPTASRGKSHRPGGSSACHQCRTQCRQAGTCRPPGCLPTASRPASRSMRESGSTASSGAITRRCRWCICRTARPSPPPRESNLSVRMWSRSPVLILDRGSWNVVAMPFKKFFNYGEKDADRIDWGSAKVYEKLDGSLLTLYFHSGEWHVALSKRNPRSCTDRMESSKSNPIGQSGTFAELFWSVWCSKGHRLPLRHTACYMFEPCNPPPRATSVHGLLHVRAV